MTQCNRGGQQPLVTIRFCGGCNPRIGRGEVAAELAALLSARGWRVVYNELDAADAVVYLSGCGASCAQRYSDSRLPAVAVAGGMIDGLAAPEEELARIAADKVAGLLEAEYCPDA